MKTWATRIFWVAVLTHCVVWTLLPGLCHPGYKPDVVEQLFIGREWVLASAKHPALPALMLEAANHLTGRAFLTPFLVSQFCVLITVWGVWRLGLSVLNPVLALVGSLSMLLYWYFALESINYNQHMPLIAFWTLSIVFVHEALKTNKTVYWLLSGAAIALAIYSKYPTGLLVAAFLVFFALDPKARKTWRTPGPYLTTGVAALLVVPLGLWILQHGTEGTYKLFYKMDTTLLARTENVLDFLFSQIGFFGFVLLCLCTILGFPWRLRRLREEDRWNVGYLVAMILIPLFLYMLIGFVKPARLRPDFGSSLWPLLGIVVLLLWQTSFDAVHDRSGDDPKAEKPPLKKTWYVFGRRKPLRAFFIALLIWEVGYITVFFIQCFGSVHLVGHMRRFQFPMENLGLACESIWEEKVGGDCLYVTGDWWLAGNASLHMEPVPSVHAFGQFGDIENPIQVSSWSTDEDVNRYGGMVFWEQEDDSEKQVRLLREHFPEMEILPTLILPYSKAYYIDSSKIPPLRICMGIVYPEKTEVIPGSESTGNQRADAISE